MANIRIERVPIKAFNLGLLGFDHLQLVFEQDSLTSTPIPQEGWFVMEGLRAVKEGRVVLDATGDNGITPLRLANEGYTGAALEAEIGTPETRGSRIISVADPQSTWTTMAAHANGIANQAYDYNARGAAGSLFPTLNSTSFITSVLYAAGIDILSVLPYNMRMSPGMETLLGGNGDDHLRIQAQFTALFGGFGRDLLQGVNDVTRIDRMYGGADPDLLSWSHGKNYMHGGDSSWHYKEDGTDTINYSGSGGVHVELNRGWVEHRVPQYFATTNNSIDYLFSIERLVWDDQSNDVITTGPGVELIETPLSLYLGGEDASAGPSNGDTLDFSGTSTGLTINRANDVAMWITAPNQQGSGGLWVESAEWVIGSSGDDQIYAYSGLRGIEGGTGNDTIDARHVSAFSGDSPQGYDVELTGGDGEDTIVTNAGRTLIAGGAGADMIVISAVTSGESTTEIVIENADSDDTLFIPYNFFNLSGDGYEGSDLLQLTGAVGSYDDLVGNGWELYFETRLQEDIWTNLDEIAGVIDFAGSISYRMENSDLIISIMQGERETEEVVIEDTGATETRHYNNVLVETETIVRVVGFDLGDLGLQFIDPGPVMQFTVNGDTFAGYQFFDDAVLALNPGMHAPLPEAPIAPSSDPNDPDNPPTEREQLNGTEDADLIALVQPSYVDAGAGDDTVTSTGNNDDTIDGGEGADTMAGGDGDDHYYVDNAGDVVSEAENEGLDTVVTTVDYTLGDHVENLTLAEGALYGNGNGLANRIVGNIDANTLSGLDGNDTLYGDFGNDTLIGGEGSDTYTYVRGDGNDVIIETGTGANDVDMLRLFQDITPDDLSAIRLGAAANDLVLVLRGGGQITIADAFGAGGMTIEQIAFDDGTVWNAAEIDALAQSAIIVGQLPPEAHNDTQLVYGGIDNVLLADALLANDIDPAGGGLSVQSVFDVSVGSASITSEGNIAFDLPAGYEGPLTFRYTVVDSQGATATAMAEMSIVANAAPVLATALDDQSAIAGEAFTLTLPHDLFTDPDGDFLSYFASLADGSELPAWLTFNHAAFTFSGTAPAGTSETLDIRVEAYDGFVLSATSFLLSVGEAAADPDQTFAGTAGDDVFIGGSGNDTFATMGNGQGFEFIQGGDGTDVILGSPWNDTLGLVHMAGNLDGIEAIDMGSGNDKIALTGSNDVLDLSGIIVTGVELIDAGAGNDTVTGSAGNDTIRGNAGDDILSGGAGDDTFTILGNPEGFDVFDGGDGTDTILGSAWNDTLGLASGLTGIEVIDMGSGNDKIALTSGDDTLDLSGVTVAGVELIDAGAGNDTVTGSAGSDTIRGNAGDDILSGGAGDDTFTILGNPEGFDIFDGGDGTDTILGSAWNDTLGLAAGLTGIEAIDMGGGTDKIKLTAGDDSLDLSGVTVSGVELIDAGAGNDTLVASSADDILQGGSGNDTFAFRTGFGHDTIVDFDIGTAGSHDLIDLSDAGFADFAALLAAASEINQDTVISIDTAQSLTLSGVSLQSLTADHFLLV